MTWIQKKGGKKYNSFEDILRLKDLSTEARKDLLEFLELLRDVQRLIGKLPPKPKEDLNINSRTNNSNHADEFCTQKGPTLYPKATIKQIVITNTNSHKMQTMEISTIEASISELASYLEHPYIQLKDYQNIFDGLAEIVGMLIGVLKANFRNGSGLVGRNATYWWMFMGEVSRAFFLMGYCTYKLENYDDVVDWVSHAAIANGDELFLADCDRLCSDAALKLGKVITQGLVELERLNSRSYHERAKELIEVISPN